jgi:Cu/Ag efflux pump CusA
MMRWIVESSLKLRLVMAAVAAGLMFFGFTRLRHTPVDALPEFSRPYVEIQAEALGLSAQEVEALLTTPLEADLLNGVSWVDEIRSESLPGLCSIVLVFDKGVDIMRARQMVQERLIAIHALPNVSTPPMMLNPTSSTSRVMAVGLTSNKLSLVDMSVLARWTMKPRLMGLPGVANVSIWGQRERQLQVQVDPQKLREQNVTLLQVIKTAGNALWASPLSFLEASTPGVGGWIDTPNQRLSVQHFLPISNAEDLAKVTVEGAPSKRLGDVATVVEDHQPLIGDAVVKDAPALTLVIEKFPWANTVEVTRQVDEALDALRPGLAGIEIDPTLFRPATFLGLAISNLSSALIIGGILMVVAFFAFLFNWRMALVSTVAVLASMIAAVTVLYVRGAEVNLIVIAGLMIALAAMIDDATVDVQNIVRRFRQARAEDHSKPTTALIYNAILEVRSPLLYATVIMALAVVPLLFLEGVSGAFWKPLATSYLLALAASFVVALAITPALSLMFLRDASLSASDSPVMNMLRSLYSGLFGWAARAPRPAFITVCALFVVGLVSIPFLRQESLLPDLKETDLLVRWEGSTSASHSAMNRVTTLASRELRTIPGVRNVSGQMGRAITSDKHTNINTGELWVSLDPAADYEATVAAVEQTVSGYPGLSPEVLTYSKAKIRNELSGTNESFIVRVYGEDMSVIRKKAEEVKSAVAKISGVVEAQVQYPEEMPTVEIEPNLEKMKAYGLKPGDVRRTATSLVGGILVGSLYEEQKVFEVLVYGTPEIRHSISSIEELLVDTPTGGHVRLKDVADVRIVPSVTVINRDAVARCMDVTANVSGRDLAGVAAEVERSIKQINFPLEYRAELLGEYAERLASQQRVTAFTIAAAIGILLIMQVFFKSWRLAAAMFVALPTALVGGALTAIITGGGLLSFGSIIGFIAIFGLAMRNSMTLIGRYRRLEHDSDESFGPELVQRGTREQSGPILMTAVTTALAILPLAFAGNVAGLEIMQPMAVVALGGLITATIFTLAGVPALYLLFGAKREADLDLHVTVVTEEEMHEAIERVHGMGEAKQFAN